MNILHIAFRSLKYYFRSDLTIALGVAAATAVLTGALIVGDSMRQSLRELTLERLGKIDEMLVSDGFFRAELANEIKETSTFQANYQSVEPAILFPGGTVEFQTDQSTRRAGQVTVLGITNAFWSFDRPSANHQESDSHPNMEASAEVVIINEALASDLQISQDDVDTGKATITVRIPKQTQLSGDSALGRKTDLIESLVDLKVLQIIPTERLGRFGLHPSQSDPLNVYLPIGLLQESLGRSVLKHKADLQQANVLLLSAKTDTPPPKEITEQLRHEIRPTLEDYGLLLKRVKQEFQPAKSANDSQPDLIFDYWSLSSDKLVVTEEAALSIAKAFPNATPVFTYLANDIRLANQETGIPFSMISAVDFDDSFWPDSVQTNQPVQEPGDHEIVLNRWAAEDLGATIGDKLKVTYFEPESTHGTKPQKTAEFTLVDIAAITRPDEPFRVGRRIRPPVFLEKPTVANDPDLTPEVPGVTDAATIKNWDLPFETNVRIPEDEDYWDFYRTTPKAFISLKTGRELWASRFGETTSFRIPVSNGSAEEIQTKLLDQFAADNAKLGIHIMPLKRRGLKASSGSTPFDALFLALSMFVIGAALILVALLFRLGLQQRASEVGVLKATGFDQKQIRRLWLSEMTIVSFFGAALGIVLGVGYAGLMIWGLTTWWVGAISRPFLVMHVSPLSLCIGLFSGLVICFLTIAWSLRRTRSQPIRNLLTGQLESNSSVSDGTVRWKRWIAPVLIVGAVGLSAMATQLAGEAQAGSFMGAGFLVLSALLMFVYQWLKSPSNANSIEKLSVSRLAMFSAKRNPLRSTLTIGLVAVASFLIAAVSSFRLSPTNAGTGGFDWVAQSSQPIFDDLLTPQAQMKVFGAGKSFMPGTEFRSIRYKSGEDASCNNLYQSTQPRALGVSDRFIKSFDSQTSPQFAWGGSLAQSAAEKQNPWQLLASKEAHAGTAEDPIPVILDKNTANYSLKIYATNTVKLVQYDSGESLHYRVVGFLANTILQGSLIMSEIDFEEAFPTDAGYQYFLIRDGASTGSTSNSNNVSLLEEHYSDQGFDARSAPKLLANFMAVQNTYLSTFQTLGALGLLLGTFGLAAVQIRSVLERKKELGLMRAVGFSRSKLAAMVLMENAWLLMLGLAVGIGAALFTTVPHWFVGSASIPWRDLAVMFVGIILVGLLASWIGSRVISKMPLLDSLRS